jgi:hypothetical protein
LTDCDGDFVLRFAWPHFVIIDLISVFLKNFGVLFIFRQQHVVKRGVLRLQQGKTCAEFVRRIGKSLAQNFENFGTESQET